MQLWNENVKERKKERKGGGSKKEREEKDLYGGVHFQKEANCLPGRENG